MKWIGPNSLSSIHWSVLPVVLACLLSGANKCATSLWYHVKDNWVRNNGLMGFDILTMTLVSVFLWTDRVYFQESECTVHSLTTKTNTTPVRYKNILSSGSTDTLSIPLFAFPLPWCSKRGSIHSSIWPNQVWIKLTAVCQSFLALWLQICNLQWCLLGIFNSYINTGIVSVCHLWPDSRYWLQPPGLDRQHILALRKMICVCVFSLLGWHFIT